MSGVKIGIGPTGRRVAGNIESTRRAAKLSLIEMSKRLNEIARPLSANSLAGIEAGERRVDVEDLLCIADVLGVTVARLLGDESVREDEPARPVEDREPVGPYAPTRDGRTLNARYEADPGLFEAGYRQGWRERDTPGSTPRYPDLTIREASVSIAPNVEWLAERFDRIDTALTKPTDLFVDSRDEIERIKASAECTIDHSAEPVQIQFKEAFERGRQQGDADRAERGQADFERGVTMGRANREAELLDQGWTPPGAIVQHVHEIPTHTLEVTSGPTDYEVWRDALSMATEWASMHGRDPELNEIPGFAFWFHGQLMAGYEAAADLPAKETPGAEADYPF